MAFVCDKFDVPEDCPIIKAATHWEAEYKAEHKKLLDLREDLSYITHVANAKDAEAHDCIDKDGKPDLAAWLQRCASNAFDRSQR